MGKAKHIDLTLEEYHARDEWSNSQISTFCESVPKFHGMHVTGELPKERKKVWDTGTVAHAIFAGESIDKVVAVIPPEVLDKAGKRSGGKFKEWKAEHADIIDMKESEMAPIRRMIANAHAHPIVRHLLDHAEYFEHSLFYEDEETGLLLRNRSDLICDFPDGKIVVDFKTTRAVTPQAFSKDAHQYGYHRQQAWYWNAAEQAGWDVKGFVFIAVDKSPAHECNVYELTEEAHELGKQEVRAALDDLARRIEEGEWHSPTFGETIQVDLPAYAYNSNWSM